MSCLPFPSFFNLAPVDADNDRAALAAVGSCRIDPLTCTPGNVVEEYTAIYSKNKEQADVDCNSEASKDEKKKEKKKRMKQGVAMAAKYLQQTLRLDVSIIDVQIKISSQQIVETDGCICACFLDAGCKSIVIDGTNLQALDSAKIPRERVIASFEGKCGNTSEEEVAAALRFANTISVSLAVSDDKTVFLESVDTILSYIPDKADRVIFELTNVADAEASTTELVAAISKKCKDWKGSIALVDPTAHVLGMNYAA